MYKLITAVLFTTLLWGCSDFGNMNVDPNNPSTAKTELLLTNAQREISDNVAAVTGVLYVQYMSETQYTEASRYDLSSFDFSGWYSGPLQDLQTIIDLNTDEATKGDVLSGGSNANQIAVARILKVYFYNMMTDRWGMLPYNNALKGKENLRPEYDAMPDIYEGMLTELNEAVAQMDNGAGVKGDILFNGDMGKWARFANSLRMRIALRMADSNTSLASSEFVDAYNDGIITEDIMYPYLPSANNENPWYSRFRTRTDYAISKPLADTLKSLNDLRVTKYGNPAADVDNNNGTVEMSEIIGMPYGIENAGDITNASISFPGAAIGAGGPGVGIQDAGLPIITTAELNFALAEAVERGWISGVAEDFYLDGIEASWRQWGVYGDGSDFAAYVAQPEVAYNSTEWNQKIGYQKWVALYPSGYEAWAEWRRLDYPQLTPAPDALNASGTIPVRHGYPSSEAELNTENYESAVSSQGPDDLTTNLWWDVN